MQADGRPFGLFIRLIEAYRSTPSSFLISTIGLDIGKNTFHLIGLDKRGAIAMRIKISRNQLVRRLANLLTLPHRPGGRLWLAPHSPPDSLTRPPRPPDPGPVRQALP